MASVKISALGRLIEGPLLYSAFSRTQASGEQYGNTVVLPRIMHDSRIPNDLWRVRWTFTFNYDA